MTEAVIARLESVSHRYGATVALDNVTIEIPARKMVAVIGPDGVGKSTLLALISGVRTIQSGQISVFEGNLANASHLKTLRTRIAYMPQGLGRNLYPTLSVFENIDFFGRLFGQSPGYRRARITELLTATGLNSFEKRPAGKLSGGMKQKLSLCCALINDPDLLILDEPTTGVDPLSRGQFWDLINTIRARRPQMSVMVATAYMDEAQRFDWLVAMDDGKIIAHGRLQELLDKAGERTLEEAFIALLPQQKRAFHQKVIVRPRPTSTDEIAIEAEGLTRRFGDFVAVDHVNFKIGRGEIFGFLGSNGCGKSTTMKMLTGFLPATEGWAKLFGKPMSANDMEMRRNVGYMTQAFSLYGELTVRQNLELHAQLYHLSPNKIEGRVQELLKRYDLKAVAGAKPASLPLGIKQRLQLAVAVLHEPAILILDEPTSGVDPIARDAFWRTLIDLSRNEGVTIFLSTHFMNEAERCDRISLMHAGKVLAVGAPLDLVKERGSNSLEDTFIGYLADAAGLDVSKKVEASRPAVPAIEEGQLTRAPKWFDLTRLWAYARRETIELLRDPIRLAFAVLGPIILMAAFGYGISFDIENLQTAAFDQDNTPQSRRLLDGFAGSQYFAVQPPIRSAAEADQRLRSGNTQIVIEIPSGFGRDLLNGMRPEVDATVDGAMTFRGETARSYVNAAIKKQGQELQHDLRRPGSPNAWSDDNIESRYRYNQAFLSVNAMVPSVFMLMLCLIPAIMSAISVVREKETGSIANFRSTPITKFEFLLGKQVPYVGVAMVNFAFLFLMAIFVFDVPIKGPFFTLLIGTVIYVISTTGFGQLISSFTRTQVAAVFATAILSIVPAVNFSGIFAPVSSLSGGAKILGLTFPSAWYQPITVGVFAKALGMLDLWRNVAAISVIALVFFTLSLIFLRKQET